jgi:hypothetical protein
VREEVAPFLGQTLSKKAADRFSPEALSIIFEQARGIPALILAFASKCLKSNQNGQISTDLVSAVLEDLETN